MSFNFFDISHKLVHQALQFIFEICRTRIMTFQNKWVPNLFFATCYEKTWKFRQLYVTRISSTCNWNNSLKACIGYNVKMLIQDSHDVYKSTLKCLTQTKILSYVLKKTCEIDLQMQFQYYVYSNIIYTLFCTQVKPN